MSRPSELIELQIENARLTGTIEGMKIGIGYLKSELEFYKSIALKQHTKAKHSKRKGRGK